MAKHLDAETLRAWLDAGRPVTVVDVRNAGDRAQWAIPGSMHVDACEALKAGLPSPLSDVTLAGDRPVVTVCNAGKMSERGADELSGRGFDVFSLAGGMKAWSLAWNCAGATVGDAVVTQVRRTGKGCLSYLVASGGRGAVIDPALPADVYLALADARQVRIGYVLDTHIHADHISRARQLASASGADLLLPAQDRARFPHRALRDGDGIEFGGSRLVALATPGHTMESMSYLVDGAALFTGDTLFPSSVGRPDLLADAASARVRAALLYRSVARLLGLGPDVMLFAGHASAPPAFDGVPIAASLRDVNAQLGAWIESEAAFLERILTRIPATPPNFERIVAFNEAGEFPDGDVTDLEAGANRCAIG